MDEQKQPVLIIDEDDVSRAALAAVMAQRVAMDEGFPVCEVVARGGGDAGRLCVRIGGEGADFTRPVRVGAVLDRVVALWRQKQVEGAVAVGPYMLDMVYGRLSQGDDAQGIDLTDKECEILLRLHGARGGAVSRADLLSSVWGYVEDLETHTLETHIYRLRQKIEDDPSSPVIVVTMDEGYALA